MRKEEDILYETAHYWLTWDKFKDRRVAHIWKFGLTHSVLAGTIDLRDRKVSVARAIAEIDRREAQLAG